MSQVDVLAIGAHPDDVELGVGGTLRRLVRQGLTAAILDLSAGEASTRGTRQERRAEAARAAQILGVERCCAGLPDGRIESTREQVRTVAALIRSMQPAVILTHAIPDRHPDHAAAAAVVRAANFAAGLEDPELDGTPHRAARMFFFRPYYEDAREPQIVFDISDDFERKLEALRAHTSQFYNPGYPGKPTYISSEAFWRFVEGRAAYWGARASVRYAEPIFCDAPVPVDTFPGLPARP